jgi:hypothetical protein
MRILNLLRTSRCNGEMSAEEGYLGKMELPNGAWDKTRPFWNTVPRGNVPNENQFLQTQAGPFLLGL